MKFYLDSGNISHIRHALENYPIAGVTTNPSILAHERKNPGKQLHEIRSLLGNADLHVQVIGSEFTEIMEEATDICQQYGSETFIKIPVTETGVKAIRELTKRGIKVTATAIATPLQAILAAEAGAKFLAPYLNRIDNMQGDGIGVVDAIQTVIRHNHMDARLLVASFKNTKQILDAAKLGVYSVTIPFDLLKSSVSSDLTISSIETFKKDWLTVQHENQDN